MINKQELLEYSKVISLDPGIVEKDYVLGWILAGVHHNPKVRDSWVFKGGTCLKKCYFETYRFSEDLDFTVLDPAQIEESFLRNVMNEITLWVNEESGLELPGDRLGIDIFNNLRGVVSAQCKMGFIGPLQRRSSIPNIKFDLSSDEVIVLEPIIRGLYHPYSDRIDSEMQVLCYSYEEVFAEKVRALHERSRPRDLYDVIHLYRNKDLITDLKMLVSVLEEKCAYKGIEPPTFELIDNHPQKRELSAEWDNMLRHQIAILPALEHYWNALPEFFDWLYRNKVVELEHIAVETGSEQWSQGRLVHFTPSELFIERIQFAASNRLYINLRYNGKNRIVEPYSFRKSRAGQILFYAFEVDSSQIKCYRIDKFQSLDVTSEIYTPRYAVEISSTGIIQMPIVRRRRR